MRKNLRKYAMTGLLMLIMTLVIYYPILAYEMAKVKITATPNFVPIDDSEPESLEVQEEVVSIPMANDLSHMLPSIFAITGVVVAFAFRQRVTSAIIILFITTFGTVVLTQVVIQLW